MAENLRIELITPQGVKFSAEVDEATLPGELGELGILLGHLPVLTGVDIGEVRLREGEQTHHFAIGKGYAEVLEDRISVLTESCLTASEIDVEAEKAALEEHRAALDQMKDAPIADEAYRRELDAFKRASTRLSVAGAKH